jgi:N-methylhydantoinase A
VVVPNYPGYFSAWGMIMTKPKVDFAQTRLTPGSTADIAVILETFADLRRQAMLYFEESFRTERVRLDIGAAIDTRYLGQQHTIAVPVDIDTIDIPTIVAAFHRKHQATYGFQMAGRVWNW